MSNAAPFRLAIRMEGRSINAYYAKPDTMDGAVLIGSINSRLCSVDPAVFLGFRDTMTLAMVALAKDALGVTVTGFEVQDAPEGEKAGHA
ncbi:MAG: hypothetical protein RL375_2623 [Pseudomonadota bacterium]|jgi:hypothetical protein